jgi:uncharacterized protein (TIGR04222 family)
MHACWAQILITGLAATTTAPPGAGGDPWRMDGPTFVRVFALALVLTAAVASVVRWRLDDRRTRSLSALLGELSTAELAYLSNGRSLVAVAVVWQLWRAEALRVDNDQLAEVVGGAAPVDATLLESLAYARAARATSVSVGPAASHGTFDDAEQAALAIVDAAGALRPDVLARRLRRHQAVDELVATLEQHGCMRAPRTRRRMQLGVVAVFAPLLLIGAARLGIGIARDEPLGNLLVLVVAAGILFGLEVVVTERPTTVTRAVLRACRDAVRSEDEIAASLAAPTPTLDEGRALAVLGVGVLWYANPVGAASLSAPTAMLIAGQRVSMASSLRIGGAVGYAGSTGA